MKKTILIIVSLLGFAIMANAQNIVDGVSVDSLKIERNNNYMAVEMNIILSQLDVESNRAVLLTPRLVKEQDTLDLPSIGIYGRQRYFFYVRNGESMLSGKEETTFRANEKPESVPYHCTVPYQAWMNGSKLELYRSDYGCCSSLLAEQAGELGMHKDKFFPELVYIRPKGDIGKERSLEGEAFVDFPVDQTVIYPNYRRNVEELGKIQASIDSVKNDSDITITQVWLKGYASPESPYSHNTDLAIGRTAALKKHIQQLYKFDENIIATDYEPENWAGLRKYVEESNIDNRTEILALIDKTEMDPDAREWKIKSTYPKEYKFLLDNCYPALRKTDYRIAYIIRTFSDIEEIKRVLKTQPQKLSLNEFYLAAQELAPGTEEFTEVFEIAVRMFPNDETANLNAANAAMRRNELDKAERYLAKAGNTPEAVYARGAHAYLSGNYDAAETLFRKAKEMGVKEAVGTLEELPKRKY